MTPLQRHTDAQGQMGTDRIGPQGLINRAEFVRLLEQALHRLGYAGAAAQLEKESVSHEPLHIEMWQQCCASGPAAGPIAAEGNGPNPHR